MSSGLRNLKSKVDILDLDKLVPLLVDLRKLSDVVKNDVIKKTEYDEVDKKVNNIKTTDTNGSMTQKICQIGSQIPDHDHAKCVTTDKFSNIKVDNFNTILKIMLFDDKLKNLNKGY